MKLTTTQSSSLFTVMSGNIKKTVLAENHKDAAIKAIMSISTAYYFDTHIKVLRVNDHYSKSKKFHTESLLEKSGLLRNDQQ